MPVATFRQGLSDPSNKRRTPLDGGVTVKTEPGCSEEQRRRQSFRTGSAQRGRCGDCDGCKRENCGSCRYCKDMVRFGGKNILKKACEERKCEDPILGKITGGKSSDANDRGSLDGGKPERVSRTLMLLQRTRKK